MRASEANGLIVLGPRALLADGTTVTADHIDLGRRASVYDVAANGVVRGRRSVVRGAINAPLLPLEGPSCSVPTDPCGSPDVVVLRGTAPPLTPGKYGHIFLEARATLSLEPGDYDVCSMTLARRASVRVGEGPPTTIRVHERVGLGIGAGLGPAERAFLPLLEVGQGVFLDAWSSLEGLLLASDVDLVLRPHSSLVGAFTVARVSAARRVHLACPDPDRVPPPPTSTTSSSSTSTTSTSRSTTSSSTSSTSTSRTTTSSSTSSTSTSRTTTSSSTSTSRSTTTSSTTSTSTTSSTTSTTASDVPPGASLVEVHDRELVVRRRLVDGSLAVPAPYVIRGVNWSAASPETNTTAGAKDNAVVRRPEFGRWYMTDVPLMRAMHVNTVRTPIDLGLPGDPQVVVPGRTVLDELYRNGIMVVMTVDDAINDRGRVAQVVALYRDHPAVLAWSIGNEWNINLYYGTASNIADAAVRTQAAAALIKSLDRDHPVVSSYGEININQDGKRLADTKKYVDDCLDVDIWSLNVYRGDGFGTLFLQWKDLTTKPMFLGEFGTDALETIAYPPLRCPFPDNGVRENEAAQADWDLRLWVDLFANLSARDPDRVAVGGTLFEWNDEWWKVVPPGVQWNCGHDLNPGGHPDVVANEEYFGIVDIGRRPRAVYQVFAGAFDSSFTTAGQGVSFRADSAGSTAPGPDFAAFWKGRTLFYQQFGHSLTGGRGFNFAVIDPDSGRIEETKNFDTWGGDATVRTAMVTYVEEIAAGKLVLVAVADEAGLDVVQAGSCVHRGDSEPLLAVLESLGSHEISSYCYWDSWAMIAVKGEVGVDGLPQARAERLVSGDIASAEVSITLTRSERAGLPRVGR